MSIIEILYQITQREYIYYFVLLIFSLIYILFLVTNRTKKISIGIKNAFLFLVPNILFFLLFVLTRWKISSSNSEYYSFFFFLLVVFYIFLLSFNMFSKTKSFLFVFPILSLVIFTPIIIFSNILRLPLSIFLICLIVSSVITYFSTPSVSEK